MPVYGVAGYGLEDEFGKTGAAGAAGELRLAAQLRADGWLDLEDTHVFFGVRVDKADADCVVVRGRRVVILDAKAWRGGTYRSFGPLALKGAKSRSKTSAAADSPSASATSHRNSRSAPMSVAASSPPDATK